MAILCKEIYSDSLSNLIALGYLIIIHCFCYLVITTIGGVKKGGPKLKNCSYIIMTEFTLKKLCSFFSVLLLSDLMLSHITFIQCSFYSTLQPSVL